MEDEDTSELAETSLDTTGKRTDTPASKQACSGLGHQANTLTQLVKILVAAEEQRQEQHENHQDLMAVQKRACDIQDHTCDIQDHACDIQDHACDIQECTSLALLDILHQSLLSE